MVQTALQEELEAGGREGVGQGRLKRLGEVIPMVGGSLPAVLTCRLRQREGISTLHAVLLAPVIQPVLTRRLPIDDHQRHTAPVPLPPAVLSSRLSLTNSPRPQSHCLDQLLCCFFTSLVPPSPLARSANPHVRELAMEAPFVRALLHNIVGQKYEQRVREGLGGGLSGRQPPSSCPPPQRGHIVLSSSSSSFSLRCDSLSPSTHALTPSQVPSGDVFDEVILFLSGEQEHLMEISYTKQQQKQKQKQKNKNQVRYQPNSNV